MADTHYEGDENLYHHRQLMDAIRIRQVQNDRIVASFKAMEQMKDGDGSQASHFAKVVALHGIKGTDDAAKLATAKALYDEVASDVGNQAAARQLHAKLG